MINIFSLMLLLFSFTSIKVYAVPGLERQWKKIHPESAVTCGSCHQSGWFTQPAMKNVTEEGRSKYREILSFRKQEWGRSEPIKSIPRVDFVVFGDSRSDFETHKLIVKLLSQDDPQAIFHTGDLVGSGSDMADWEAVIPLYQPFIEKKNFYHSCGNHEGNYCTNNPFRKALGNDKAFYSVEFNGLTFLALDSNRITSEELKWLSQLPVGKKYIPFFHHPAYPVMAGHGPSDAVIKNFIPQFKRLGVKLVFTGHNHGYDRNEKDGITYVTAGGGGAPLYPCGDVSNSKQFCISDYHYVRCALSQGSITCQAKLIDGTLADSVTVKLG